MTLDEFALAVWGHGGELRVVAGRIRYRGPRLAPDDPIRAAIAEHRDVLLRVLTAVPRSPARFEPGPPHFEQLGPNIWRETAWSAARCIRGDDWLAPGDRLHCPVHAARFAAGSAAEPVERGAGVAVEGRAG